MPSKKIIITFHALIINFLIVVLFIFVANLLPFIKGELFLVPFVTFMILGFALVYFIFKEKNLKGKLERYLLVAGGSAASVFVFVFLHNAFYALEELSRNIIVLRSVFAALSVISFIFAVITAPLLFLLGAGLSIKYLIKNKQRKTDK